jgi:predicted transcriptional regulator
MRRMENGIGRTLAPPDPGGIPRVSLRRIVAPPPVEPRRPSLGALERAVLDALWSGGAGDVKAVHRAVGEARGISPNTVHSALERLVRKRLLARRKRGRAFEYEARVSRHEFLREELSALLEATPGSPPSLLTAAFVDWTERAGADRLAELEALLRARRQGERR